MNLRKESAKPSGFVRVVEMKGILYGIGIGPGDPEHITLKAVRMMKEVDIIAAPGKDVKETTAYKIAVQAVSEIADKELLPIYMPMVLDRKQIESDHRKGADAIEECLKKGKSVGFITLGDPTVYSTYSYVEKLVKDDGFETAYISGITSFCAAAASLGIPISEWQEPFHVIPAVHQLGNKLDLKGNYVLMKSGKKMAEVKEILAKSGRNVTMVENCGLENEHRYFSVEEIPDNAGYFSLIIAKENRER